jgi:predicted nucleic-acid-binding Zn-ribbon protein
LQCATDNEDLAAVCVNCGATFAAKEVATEKSIPSILQMTDLKSGKVITINGNCTIGRSGNVEIEFFAEDMYISEYHCKIILENGVYKIEHLPTAKNPTKINDVSLSKGISSIIRDGDYLTIADKMFEISICADAVNESTKQEIATPDATVSDIAAVSVGKTIYVITCPKCGSEYEVSDVNARINECSYCDDYDKHEISRVGAKVKYAN